MMSNNLSFGKMIGLATFLLGPALMAASASAQVGTLWTNPTLGNWFVASNWSFGVPNSGLIAEINNGGDALVDAPGAVAAFLYLGDSGSGSAIVRGSGTLTLNGILNVWSGSLDVNSGGRLVLLQPPILGATTEIGENGYSTTGTVLVTGAGSYLSARLYQVDRNLDLDWHPADRKRRPGRQLVRLDGRHGNRNRFEFALVRPIRHNHSPGRRRIQRDSFQSWNRQHANWAYW